MNNKDRSYVATQLHFENLKQRYGKLIIILNLLKVGFPRQVKFYTLHLVYGRLSVYLCYLWYQAGKHRENILREEFEKAILFINGGTRRENHLIANHFDLNKHYKRCCIFWTYYKHKLVGCFYQSYLLKILHLFPWFFFLQWSRSCIRALVCRWEGSIGIN